MDMRRFITVKKPPSSTSEKNLLLVDRVAPTKSGDVVCDDMTLLRARDWIRRFKARDPTISKMMMLSGPSGTGKSVLAKLILEEHGYDVFVVTSGQTKKDIVDVLEDVYRSDAKAIIFDDVDIIQDVVQGIVPEIMKRVNPLKGRRSVTKKDRDLYASTHWFAPIVVTCKRHDYGKIMDVAKQCEVIHITRPSKARIAAFLRSIVAKDRLAGAKDVDIDAIVDASKRDVRQAIVALDMAIRGGGGGQGTKSLGSKDEDIDAIHAVNILMKSSRTGPGCKVALRLAQMDLSVIPLMVHENYLDVCQIHHDGPDEGLRRAATAIDDISNGDVAENMMYATGNFDMYDVCSVFSVVGPSAAVRTQSTRDVRFGNLWSKISNMYVRRRVLNELRDAVPAVRNASGILGQYDTIQLLRAKYEAAPLTDLKGLARICDYPDELVRICRFGLRSQPMSLVSLQTIQKRLIKEKKEDQGTIP